MVVQVALADTAGAAHGDMLPPPAVPLLYTGHCAPNASRRTRAALGLSCCGNAAQPAPDVPDCRATGSWDATSRAASAAPPADPPPEGAPADPPPGPGPRGTNPAGTLQLRPASASAPAGGSAPLIQAGTVTSGALHAAGPPQAGAGRPSSAPTGSFRPQAFRGAQDLDRSGGGGNSGGLGLHEQGLTGFLGTALGAAAASAAATAEEEGVEPVQICFDFTKGACQRGPACKYSHDVALIAAVNSHERGICFDFLRGSCARGVMCRFSHNMANIQAQQARAQV